MTRMSMPVQKKQSKRKPSIPAVFIDGVRVEVWTHPGKSSVPVSVLRKAVQTVKAQNDLLAAQCANG